MALFFSLAVAAAAQPVLPHRVSVCCSPTACLGAPSSGTFRSFAEALPVLRALRRVTPGAAIVDVLGTCHEPLYLTEEDGGVGESTRVTIRGVAGTNPGISGAFPLHTSDFSPITDAGILAQLQPSAREAARQVDLGGMGVSLTPPGCQGYVGGNSVMTPGLLQPAGAELFMYGDSRVGGEASPLTPARYPNAVQGGPTVAWASLFGVNYTASAPGITARLEMDPAAAARSGLWAQQLQQDPGSVRAKYIGELGWLEHTQALVAVGASSPPPSPQPPPTCGDTVANYGIMGSDLAGTPTSNVGDAGECCALCSARTNCRFWSYSSSASRCYQKYQNASGAWQRNPGVVSGQSTTPHASVAVTLGAQCVSIQAEDTYGDGAVVLISNALAELDTPGEYYINRTSGMAYVWLPGGPEEWPAASPWGSPWVPSSAGNNSPAAAAAGGGGKSPGVAVQVRDRDPTLLGYVSAAPHAVVLEGVSFLTLDGLTIEGAQDAAVVVRNCTRVTLSNALLQNAGNMVVNVTRGQGVALVSCTVRGGANGGVVMEGGDRPTLTPGGHTLLNSSTSYSSRLVWLNAPMVSLDGVGHGLVGSEVYGGPHMGAYYSGNDHVIEGNHFHEVVQACDDAGALYGGRDWAYQGTVISRNTFSNLHSSEGLDVSAVYMDDMISGVRVEDNLFVNVSRAVLLGGGRWNTISGNSIHGVSQSNDAALHFDNRGMGWSNSGCNATPANPSPNMVTLLNRVPYATSPVWRARFPALVGILEDDPCMPKYNAVVNNTYCGLEGGIPFLDVPDATIESWGSVVGGNVNNESACAATAGGLQWL